MKKPSCVKKSSAKQNPWHTGQHKRCTDPPTETDYVRRISKTLDKHSIDQCPDGVCVSVATMIESEFPSSYTNGTKNQKAKQVHRKRAESMVA
eukprot:COSAG02_NODE_12678_length_1510_cov_2.821628_3_plen_93_part_00